MGTSADGYFAAVAAWSLALLALAGTADVPHAERAVSALGSGLLLGLALYLSYGLTLIALPALAVLVAARTARPLPLLLAGLAAAPVCFTLAGFNWWDAYRLLKVRYYQGSGGIRPYAYWLWGDLGTVVAAAGLASFAGLRRVFARRARDRTRRGGAARAGTAGAVVLPCRLRTGHGGRRPVRHEQGRDRTHLAALHAVAARDRGAAARARPPRMARRAGRCSRCSSTRCW